MRRNKIIFALGFFDGVHRGHQALLAECCHLAGEKNARPGAITFDKHPQSLFLEKVPPLLNTSDDRCRLLRSYGIGPICKYPVIEEVMMISWTAFINDLLSQGAAGFVCGSDFRFGHKGEGDAEKLVQVCAAAGLPCVIVPEQMLDGIRISSTHIRSLIEAGDMAGAARFLGHPHVLTGEVVGGRHLGHKLGFPTANLLLPEGVICPKHGVYACKVRFGGGEYMAVANVGHRPTVEGRRLTIEPWILDFEGDLYGREITLEFHKFLRSEQKFPDLERLRCAVLADGEETRKFFEKNRN